jgi:putative ABC transport system permease protein
MSAWRLAWTYLWARPLTAALNLVLLTLGLTVVGFVLQAQAQVQRALQRDLAGIDLVVGAKGSPMQLILAGVYHLDVPPGNIPLHEVQRLQQHPQVAQLIPLSLGDNLDGFRMVGTTPTYISHYGAQLAQGALWTEPLQAVLGADVARATGLAVGAGFYGAHGLGAGGAAHEEAAYRITGVLARCGCVLDRLVLTDTESVWRVHDEMHGAAEMDAQDLAALQADREVTLALISYSTPLAAVTFPREVNATDRLQAAAPAMEITRLLSMLGVGTRAVQWLGAVLLLVAALSVLVALWQALRERRADIALMRLLGVSPSRLAGLLLAEALWLALLSLLAAVGLSGGLTALLGLFLAQEQSLTLVGGLDLWVWWPVPLLALGVAVLAAAVPAWSAYRQDVQTLLSVRS